MTTPFARTIAAGIAASLIGFASLATPSQAGQFTMSFTPADADQQQVLGTGLQIYSLLRGLSANGADLQQNGSFNAAGFLQNGAGNHGVIVQDGNGHSGTIEQNGNNNSCGLFQFGQNTNAGCVQNGNGQSSLTTVFGF
jgi:hypothetical protein